MLPLVPTVYSLVGTYSQHSREFPPAGRQTAAAFVHSLPFLAVGLCFLALWLSHYPDPRVPQSVPAADQAMLAGHGAAYYGVLFVAPASHAYADTIRQGTVVARRCRLRSSSLAPAAPVAMAKPWSR